MPVRALWRVGDEFLPARRGNAGADANRSETLKIVLTGDENAHGGSIASLALLLLEQETVELSLRG